MANGGIIGPVNTFNAAQSVSEKITTFNSSGTLTAQATATVDYLILAGGGSGGYNPGSSYGSGGGGAGGYRTGTSSVSNGVGYTVTVGAGGTSNTSSSTSGVDSVFNSVTSTGGGKGGHIGTISWRNRWFWRCC